MLPKLRVAGSNPVSRSLKSSSYDTFVAACFLSCTQFAHNFTLISSGCYAGFAVRLGVRMSPAEVEAVSIYSVSPFGSRGLVSSVFPVAVPRCYLAVQQPRNRRIGFCRQ